MWPNVRLFQTIAPFQYREESRLRTTENHIQILNAYLHALRRVAPDGPVGEDGATRLWEYQSTLWYEAGTVQEEPPW